MANWPTGPDAGISVHPDSYRTANTIYCAFARLFRRNKNRAHNRSIRKSDKELTSLDETGYTVIPPSGKLRDLVREPCRTLSKHSAAASFICSPSTRRPTTFARFGRFGSPYAALDLTAIDPALVEFDKRTTGIEQFRELTYATHLRGGRVFLDIVINHTGWGSCLHENHPEWFLRKAGWRFRSAPAPGERSGRISSNWNINNVNSGTSSPTFS